jgi:hypothetical protein
MEARQETKGSGKTAMQINKIQQDNTIKKKTSFSSKRQCRIAYLLSLIQQLGEDDQKHGRSTRVAH